MDARKQKAHELADRASIRFAGGCYFVPSQSNGGTYTVILDVRESLCDCPDFELRGEPGTPCKHIMAARLWRDRQAHGVEQDTENVEPSAKPKRKTYPQKWVEYNAAQTNEGRHFGELLADLCRMVEEPAQTEARPEAGSSGRSSVRRDDEDLLSSRRTASCPNLTKPLNAATSARPCTSTAS